MDVKLNMPVECTDGRVGRVTGLVIVPKTSDVTHFVVSTRLGERLVALNLLDHTDDKQMIMNCTRTVVETQEPFVETEYVRVPVDEYTPIGYPAYEFERLYVDRSYVVKHLHLEPGEQEIRRGMPVYAKDGHVGRVDELDIDPSDGHVTQLLLKEGHLWNEKVIAIPTQHIKSINEFGIHLKLTRHEIGVLPIAAEHAANS